ncbi:MULTISPECIES: VanZ family protein [Clostridia]|uniref:VanZ family protein n=1 Tax=Clostridia TaxID=186801 RepID=UPI0025C12CF8|nr:MULTISPECIES: VanZ family protein [Clostridia]MCI9071021.1 VanZ family protein [Clostridium sp.]MCI9304782.1 VanZ family protein [Clostridium sp.]
MKNKRFVINLGLLVSWMILIFYMSNQPADISNKQSDLIIKLFYYIGIDLNSSLGEITSFVIRKAAHFTEYFILYCLTINVLKFYFNIKKAAIYSLLIVLGYAISDEIHQYFIPGRDMAIRDVIIDFSGGILGFIINIIIYKIKFIRRS